MAAIALVFGCTIVTITTSHYERNEIHGSPALFLSFSLASNENILGYFDTQQGQTETRSVLHLIENGIVTADTIHVYCSLHALQSSQSSQQQALALENYLHLPFIAGKVGYVVLNHIFHVQWYFIARCRHAAMTISVFLIDSC